ncbi:MAG: hypothetical protein H6710_03880 [Myxococcales bacterium]|nr:hypothetical protein [Myxococcales bacterium]MCB9705793.1 hypothetical protein [Myxococcales bacterium]
MSAPPAKTPPPPWRLGLVVLALAGLGMPACAPLVRPAPFVGARDQITDATLVGPFDGQVLDAASGEPVDKATVVAIWSYDRGDGFIAPYGSETYETETDPAGRYRVPPSKLAIRGSTVRLVAFSLVIYKRGYVGYRSESTFEGEPRTDFTVRHNKIALRKWRESDSHADHLAYLAAPREIQKMAAWENDLANLALYRELGGDAPEVSAPVKAAPRAPARAKDVWLDASKLITPDEIRQRTRTQDRFKVEELSDLERTSFYHGLHFRAVDRGEDYDIAIRVWHSPPGGMKPVVETIETTMAGATRNTEVTDKTWVVEAEGVFAVAFVDDAEQVGVLMICGDMQCHDLSTALILARELHRNLERLADAPIGSAIDVRDEERPSALKIGGDDDADEDDDEPEPEPEAKTRKGGAR